MPPCQTLLFSLQSFFYSGLSDQLTFCLSFCQFPCVQHIDMYINIHIYQSFHYYLKIHSGSSLSPWSFRGKLCTPCCVSLHPFTVFCLHHSAMIKCATAACYSVRFCHQLAPSSHAIVQTFFKVALQGCRLPVSCSIAVACTLAQTPCLALQPQHWAPFRLLLDDYSHEAFAGLIRICSISGQIFGYVPKTMKFLPI